MASRKFLRTALRFGAVATFAPMVSFCSEWPFDTRVIGQILSLIIAYELLIVIINRDFLHINKHHNLWMDGKLLYL
jgi:hypothetical protein